MKLNVSRETAQELIAVIDRGQPGPASLEIKRRLERNFHKPTGRLTREELTVLLTHLDATTGVLRPNEQRRAVLANCQVKLQAMLNSYDGDQDSDGN